jgi:multicomponent K+:H+ antiporter subunit A
MLGVVLSGNLIVLVVFWELTSISSFLLIGYWHHNQAARDGARMAFTVTAIGGLALLAGVLLIGHIVGSYDLDVVLASGDLIRSHDYYVPALLLVLLGALTKSAQFPFHFWLPNAMAAPTPVSAFLHSATMVKAGVFLMARLWPVLSGTPEWFVILGLAGMASLVLGAYLAMFQHDLKGLLAYSTISHLGLITMLLSLGSPLGAVAAIFHMLNHATFKASLFMAAGIIDHETGTRDLRRLSGLFRFMPITGTLAMVASAAMAGVPLLNGFLSKEMFFAEAVETHADSWVDRIAPYAAVLGSALAVTYSIRLIHSIFLGAPPESFPRQPHEPPFWMRFPVMLLVAACLVVGTIPGLTVGPFLHVAVASVLGDATPQYSLAVWHGVNLPLAMSVAALAAGAVLYLLAGDYLERAERAPVFGRLNGQRIFEQVMVAVSWRWARIVEDLFGTRRLQPQMRLVVAAAVAAGAVPLLLSGVAFGPFGTRALVRRHGMRAVRRLSGQVPPAGRAGHAGRYRPGDLHHLLLAVGARPGGDPARRRDRHHRAHPARPEMAAEALRGAARTRRLVGSRQALARPGDRAAGRDRHDGDLLRGDDARAGRDDRRLLPRQGLFRGRRTQRRQRDPRRLPRLRHDGRDHRARHRGADRLRAAPALPAGARHHPAPRAAADPAFL